MRLRTAGTLLWLTGLTAVVTAGRFGGEELLRRQAARARAVIGQPLGLIPPYADKVYRKRYDGRLELLVLGDSIAAGLGASRPKDTLGARMAKGLAKQTQTSVRLTTVAFVGAEASDLNDQIDALDPAYRADLAVIIVGGNDAIHRVPVAQSTADLGAAIDRLQAFGTRVVVGTCPDLGTITAVPQPLRTVGSSQGRRYAAAQRRVARAHGATVVSLAQAVGKLFLADPDTMFSMDHFHPSDLGYRRTAKAIVPHLVAALD